MDAVGEAWTDERLDDLANRMDRRFDRVDAEFRSVRTEIGQLRVGIDARFDALDRNMIIVLVTVVSALIGSTLI